jgi:hypothetical protein
VGSMTQAWKRQPGESLRWYQRFGKFRLMTLPRSIAAVYQEEKKGGNPSDVPPGSWYEAAKQWQWEERAATYDEHVRQIAETKHEAYIKSILDQGYALMHERVRALNTLALKLEEEMAERNNIWLPDVKAIGTGESAERVDIVHFNDALIEQYRRTLADLAAELGQRVKVTKQELSGSLDISGAKDSLFNKLAAFSKQSGDEAHDV